MEPVTLTTGRLVLRTVGPDDTGAVYAAAQDPEMQRWLSQFPSPYLHEHAQAFTEQFAPDGWADDSMFTFGVFLPSGELVGMLGITMRSLGVAEIGFWATKEHRGNGYITEATTTTARWAFTALSIDRIEWRAEVGNTPSRAVAQRAGFTLEGTPLRGQQQGRTPRLLDRLPTPLRPGPPLNSPLPTSTNTHTHHLTTPPQRASPQGQPGHSHPAHAIPIPHPQRAAPLNADLASFSPSSPPTRRRRLSTPAHALQPVSDA